MSRTTATLMLGSLLVVIALAAPQGTRAGDPCLHSLERPAVSIGQTVEVLIADCVFLPTVARVPVGATVGWRNTSGQGHEVVGSNLAWGAHDKVLAMGDTIGWTFTKPGVFAYSCMLHPGMTGAIIVGNETGANGSPAVSAGPIASPSEEAPASAVATDAGPSNAALALAAGAFVAGALAATVVRRRRAVVGA